MPPTGKEKASQSLAQRLVSAGCHKTLTAIPASPGVRYARHWRSLAWAFILTGKDEAKLTFLCSAP